MRRTQHFLKECKRQISVATRFYDMSTVKKIHKSIFIKEKHLQPIKKIEKLCLQRRKKTALQINKNYIPNDENTTAV